MVASMLRTSIVVHQAAHATSYTFPGLRRPPHRLRAFQGQRSTTDDVHPNHIGSTNKERSTIRSILLSPLLSQLSTDRVAEDSLLFYWISSEGAG